MSKQYYCDFDKSVFSTEEELIQHIRSRYVKVLEGKGHEVSDLHTRLQNDFPDYEINIEDGKGWYTDYIIRLVKDEGTIEQYYGNTQPNGNPDTYDQLVAEIKYKQKVIDNVLIAVSEKYQFSEFKLQNYDYGYSDDEHRYSFKFKINQEDEYSHEQYHPYSQEADEFIEGLEKYFATVLEGSPSNIYDGGYFMGYSINGVDISMIMSSKKVRLEVIE